MRLSWVWALMGGLSLVWMPGIASAEPVAQGLQFLQSMQGPTGAFGELRSEEPTLVTAEALEALRAHGLGASDAARSAEIYLAFQPLLLDSELELRTALALRQSPFFRGTQTLTTQGPGFEAPDALHLALSLILSPQLSTNPFGRPEGALAQLLAKARPDGCFAFADNAASATLTASAISALRLHPWIPAANLALSRATACLMAMQRPDGSFGTVEDTVAALQGLVGAPFEHSQAREQGRTYLLATQQADGSWEGSTRLTARALSVLREAAPDWHVMTDDRGRPQLVLADPTPLQGTSLQASLTIRNRSGVPALAIPVRFVARPLAGGAAVTLAQVSLSALAPGAQATIVATLPTLQLAGSYEVIAQVDPEEQVLEIDEGNNMASAPLRVRVENDLAVSGGSLQFAPGGPGRLLVKVAVLNLGSPLPQSVTVELFRGAPGNGGTLLGSEVLSAGLQPNVLGAVNFDVALPTATGPVAFYARVDPADTLPEADERNNQSFRFYYGGTGAAVDLQVTTPMSFVPSPGLIVPGQPFVLQGNIRNAYTTAASQVPVVVFRSGERIAEQLLPLVPGQTTVPVSFTLSSWVPASYTLVVDPDGRLSDPDRTNNQRTLTMTVMSDSAASELVASSLSSSNSSALPGSYVEYSLSVSNDGTQDVATSVRLMNVADGTIWAEKEVVARHGSAVSAWLGTFQVPPAGTPVALRACVDPQNQVPEVNENDNCAELTPGSATTDLVVAAKEMHFTPLGAQIGEKVVATARVRNVSTTEGRAVLQWWQGSPLSHLGRLLGEAPIQVPAQGEVTASFDWVRTEGPVELYVRVAGTYPRDSTPVNNGAGRHLFLKAIVDTGVAGTYVEGSEIRIAPLLGGTRPDMVLVHRAVTGTTPKVFVSLLQQGTDGSWSKLWSYTPMATTLDVVTADLDGDGMGEIVAYSKDTLNNYELVALRPDGTLKWKRVLAGTSGCSASPVSSYALGLGDLNGDGVGDVVAWTQDLRAFSGADGTDLWTTSVGSPSCQQGYTATVLDADGDGQNEVLASKSGLYALVGAQGTVRWQVSQSTGTLGAAVVDLNLDGKAEVIIPRFRNDLVARDLITGQQVQTGTFFEAREYFISAGALRQDGLPYVTLANNGGTIVTGAFTPDLLPLWTQELFCTLCASRGGRSGVDAFSGVLADVLGQGRPQAIFAGILTPPVIQDGRTGELLETFPAQLQPETGANYSFPEHTPVVVDLDADGHADIAIPFIEGTAPPTQLRDHPQYGRGEVLIFSSVHWKKQPALWPTRSIRKGQVGADLRMGSDYRWWTTHNTWNQQFDVEPATLMADLAIRNADITVSPQSPTVGGNQTVTVTLRNVGGVAASGVHVALYDGDPAAGGRHLADVVAAGPLAPRTGVATLSLPWVAYPEGEHVLYVVANADGAIEESGRENNTGSARVYVLPGTQGCDLAVDAVQFSSQPPLPQTGEALTLDVTVRNQGAQACGASTVEAWDGPRGANSPLFGAAALPALQPGAEAHVLVTGIALTGSHGYRVIADPQAVTLDQERLNNEAVFNVESMPAAMPDFTVQAVSASPSPAYPGEAVTVSVTVLNRGSPSPGTLLSVEVPGQPELVLEVPPLLTAESSVLTARITAPQASTLIHAEVDPQGTVTEFSELNNVREVSLPVEDPLLVVSGSASPGVVGPSAPVSFTVLLANQSPYGRTLAWDAAIQGPAGALVAPLAANPRLVLGGGAEYQTSLSWNTGAFGPGLYSLRIQVTEGGRIVGIGTVPFTLTAEAVASLGLVTDRGSYGPGETVLAQLRVSNTGRNAVLPAGTLQVVFEDVTGTLLASGQWTVSELAPGAFHDIAERFALSPTAEAGSYRVRAELRDTQGAVIASNQVLWKVVIVPASVVTAQLSAASPFPIGPPLQTHVLLRNTSGETVEGLLRVLLLDTPLLGQEATASTQVNLAPGSSQDITLSLPTSALAARQKVLVAQLDGRTLDRLVVTAEVLTDQEPPVITISGVTNGQYSPTQVIPEISVTDPNLSSTTITLNGNAFTSGTAVTAEGSYLLEVSAADVFGNQRQQSVSFTIDLTPPVLQLAGVAHGALLNAPVTLFFQAQEQHPGTLVATVDGAPVDSGVFVDGEGDHLWAVMAVDLAGNSTTETRAFSLDFTAPQVEITGVTEGQISAVPLTPVVTVQDAHPGSVVATLDGVSFSLGTAISAEGAHVLAVTAVDGAGNSRSVDIHFSIDQTAPVLSLDGPSHGALLNTPVTLSYSVSEPHPGTVTSLLDGLPLASGTTVNAEGDHLWVVQASDAVGNTVSETRSFSLDFTPPVLGVTGVVNGQYSSVPLTPVVTVQELHPGTLVATLDGAPFTLGTTVSTEGAHLLVIRAVDGAGNVAERAMGFTLDFTPPEVWVSWIKDGQYVNHEVAPAFDVVDANLASVTATLDGAAFTSGTFVTAEGTHILVVTAVDRAGNQTVRTVTFTLDFTLPVLSVMGVSEGALGTSFTPVFTATDASPLQPLEGVLDNVLIASGTPVTALGAHTLRVRAWDMAGNLSSVTVHFTVLQARPRFLFAACAIDSLSIQNSAQVVGLSGPASVASHGSVLMGDSSSVSGDVVSGTVTQLGSLASVGGRIYHGGQLVLGTGAQATGGDQTVSSPPTPCSCGYDLTLWFQKVGQQNDNALLQADPDISPFLVGGGLEIDQENLTLPSGRFLLDHLVLTGSSTLQVVPGGSVELFVSGSVSVSNQSTLGAAPGTGASLLLVSSASTGQAVSVLNQSTAAMQIYAPLAHVTLGNNTSLRGAVVGRQVTLTNSQTLVLSPGPQTVPAPLSCP